MARCNCAIIHVQFENIIAKNTNEEDDLYFFKEKV